MRYLLDVNALVAWGWADHTEHDRVAGWIARCARRAGDELLTAAIPQLGFVRVSVQRGAGQVSVAEAAAALAGMLATLQERHVFVADSRPSTAMAAWCRTADRTTDAHLMDLAAALNAQLATCDERIPGAFLSPRR